MYLFLRTLPVAIVLSVSATATAQSVQTPNPASPSDQKQEMVKKPVSKNEVKIQYVVNDKPVSREEYFRHQSKTSEQRKKKINEQQINEK